MPTFRDSSVQLGAAERLTKVPESRPIVVVRVILWDGKFPNMHTCEIEIANVNLSWRFQHIVPKLPGPGTEHFAFLATELIPFGAVARSFTVEGGGGSNLDEVSFTVSLLKPDLRAKMSFSGVDIEVRNVESDELEGIFGVTNAVFATLKRIDTDVLKGNGFLKIALHIAMLDSKVEDYLAKRISIRMDGAPNRVDAAAFFVEFDELTRTIPVKLTLAKSVALDNGLFLDITYELKEDGTELVTWLQTFAEHYPTVLRVLELDPTLPDVSDENSIN